MLQSTLALLARQLGLATLAKALDGTVTLSSGSKISAVVLPGRPVPITGSRALTSADNGKTLVNTSGSAYTLTATTANLPQGFRCNVIQTGAGAVTVAAGSATTVTGAGGIVKNGGAGSKITVEDAAAGVYVLNGAGAT